MGSLDKIGSAVSGSQQTHGKSLPNITSAIRRYGLAIISVALALLVTLLLQHYGFHNAILSLFLFAVALTAWYAGVGPAALSIVLSFLCYIYFFAPPIYSFAFTVADVPAVAILIVFGVMITTFSAVRRRIEGQLLQARDELRVDIDERKKAEEKLRRSEAYQVEGQRLAKTGSWAHNPNIERTIYWSEEMRRIFGLDLQKSNLPDTEEFLRLVHPDDRDRFRERIKKAVREKADFAVDYRIVLPDGTIKHIHGVGHPVLDESGNIIEYVGTDMDVTEQHEARAALQTAFEQIKAEQIELQRMIDAIPTFVAVLRPDGRLIYVNQTSVDYTGVTAEDVQREGNREPKHPEDVDRLLEERLEALAGDVPFENEQRLRGKDGKYHWFLVRYNPLRDDHGNVIRWYATATDIEQIKAKQTELRWMTDAIASYIYVLSPDGKPLYANQTVLDYTGLTLEELQKEDHRARILHPEDVERFREERRAALARGVPFENEQRGLGKDGKYRWFLVRYNPLRDDQGRIIRWYATGTDIEDRKQAEERMRDENLALREQIDQAFMFEEIVGSSPPLQNVLSIILKVAPTDSTVLITGETGTGKELIARAIHKHSQRSGQAFISVNCASIPSSLIASELFGHEKGAFTGAVQRRQGRFELAHSGTIFLDEVGDLPAEAQVTLLRVLQERQFERVGGNRILTTDVRVIAATNRDLTAAITAGTFRSDLFYRLNVFPIEMPSLRERREDIPLLLEYFIDRYARKAGKSIRGVSKKTLDLFQSYPWPGNIRELQNIIERSVIVCETENFSVDERWLTHQHIPTEPKIPHDLTGKLATQEKETIEAALRECGGRVSGPSGAAAKLGIPGSTLESKIRSLKINKNRFKTTDPATDRI
ncbi:MAG TPA: sigma 54-interacting transcriptional regulator [Candidatus Deferrimicrobiaceae bacterium]|jgi:formate hydrogenlyase transcriptional activator|nr:sigma 54-interacting transcriptional regulator [Candidatus Deferrimicrobiaceae bacterium]